MTPPSLPPSPDAAESIREAAERKLPPEEFEAYLKLTNTAESEAEYRSLIDWFMRRYPTPADRLAYVRKMGEQWKAYRTPQRPSKWVDVEEVLKAIPNLSELEAVGTAGVFQGLPFKLTEDCQWSTTVSAFVDTAAANGTIELSSPLGTLRLEDATETSSNMHITESGCVGAIRGVCAAIKLDCAQAGPAEKIVFRHFVRVPQNLGTQSHSLLSQQFEDPNTGKTRRVLLPLRSQSVDLDIYFLEEGPFLVFESSSVGMNSERFRQVVWPARWFFFYLVGMTNDRGSTCQTISATITGRPVEVAWQLGATVDDDGNYVPKPVPTSFSEWRRAGASGQFHSPSVLSQCFATLLTHPDLVRAVRYVIQARSADLELKGALLAVALEIVARHIQRKVPGRSSKLLSRKRWKDLQGALIDAAGSFAPELGDEHFTTLTRKIGNLNQASNAFKLLDAFATMKVVLREAEREAVDARNKLLHEGRLLDPGELTNVEAQQSAYGVEMRLYTAVNKLLLKCLGYEGPIWDWGENPLGDKEHVFVRL